MTVRALVPIDRCTNIHINSNDGSSDFETNTAYPANTVVTSDGKIYVSTKALTASQVGVAVPADTPEDWASVSGVLI